MEGDGVVIDEGRFPGRQGRLLFAYLVLGEGRPIPRDEIADMLWEGSPPATWDKALGVLASKLRGVLGENGAGTSSRLTAAFGCYRLDLPEGSWVDVVAAEQGAVAAEAALARGDLEAARRTAARAESLIRGPFLPGDDGTWVEEKRRELGGVRARVLSTLAEACLRSGDSQEAVRWAEQSIDAEPFRETGYRRLMEAHIAAGDRAEALRVYERCRRLLAEELGAFPSPETEDLYRGLLEAPAARPPEAAPPEPVPAGDGRRASPRRWRMGAAAAILVAGATAAALALAGRGGSSPSPPVVVPDSLVRIDPHTLRVTQVVKLASPQPDIVVAAGGFVWVTSHILRDQSSDALRNGGDRTLTRVDPSTGKARIVGEVSPCGLTADPSGDVWVADCYPPGTGLHDDVVRVDARTLMFTSRFDVPGGGGYYRGLAYSGGSLWVGNINGSGPTKPTLTEIDPQTRQEKTFRPELPAGAMGSADGYGDVWMTNFDYGTMTRFHAPTDSFQKLNSGALNPAYVLVDGNTVWIADWSGARVTRLHAVGAPRVRDIFLGAHTSGGGVWQLAQSARDIWAAVPRDNAVWRIDPDTDRAKRIVLPYLPTGVAADANNVWVALRSP